jgi:predicted acylesterase/phospholipase RssA
MSNPAEKREPKRAICLGGGGPAAGLHIGVLEGLEEKEITFANQKDVWALSCIGAWVGIVYNQADEGEEIQQTKKFFYDVFRNDKSFKSFPTNTIFAPDWAGNAEAMTDFLFDPRNYRNAFLPKEIMKSWLYTMSAIRRVATSRRRTYSLNNRAPQIEEFETFEEFSEGDFNRWTLNHVLAVNPAVRFFTAMMYKSKIDGLSRLHYDPDSRFLKEIKFDRLNNPTKPLIYHNAWNLTKQRLELFSNKGKRRINPASLCACSALPFIEQTVEIDGDIYCEGALIDTVNFKDLLRQHPDLDEIWISRIVDADQVLPPRNLHDSLANLCELFAATVGEDDVKLFKYHAMFGELPDGLTAGPTSAGPTPAGPEPDSPKPDSPKPDSPKPDSPTPAAGRRWNGTIVEIPVASDINFKWSHSNLADGIRDGKKAALEVWERYNQLLPDITASRDSRMWPVIVSAPSRERRADERRGRPGFEQRLRERLIAAGRVDPELP